MIRSISFLLIVFSLLAGLFMACKNDDPVDPTGKSLKQLFESNRKQNQQFQVTASSATTITGEQGTKVTIPGNAFTDKSGNPVTGTVIVEMQEIFSKGEMILSGKPTMAKGGYPLISGGEIFLNAMQNNDTLILNKLVQVQVPTQTVDTEMSIFVGSTDADGNFVWDWSDTAFFQQGTVYFFSTDTLGWINIDKYYYSPNATTVTVNLPAGFSSATSDVNLVDNDEATVLSLRTEDPSVYTIDRIPEGANMTLLVVSEKDGKLHLSRTNIIVSANMLVSPVMEEVSEQEILNYLKTL